MRTVNLLARESGDCEFGSLHVHGREGVREGTKNNFAERAVLNQIVFWVAKTGDIRALLHGSEKGVTTSDLPVTAPSASFRYR